MTKSNLLQTLALVGIASSIALGTPKEAAAIDFNFNWQGDAGYSAIGTFSYDEITAPTIISESGPGPTNYLQSLTVSFFDPSNNPLQSFNTVTNGVSESNFFTFNFDTSTQTLFGAFDVGGGIGVIGEQYFSGTIGSSLILYQDVDQISQFIELDRNAGAISVTPAETSVPEPSMILSFLALGGLGLTLKRTKQS